jgi:lambda family phage portal protein
MHWGNNMASWMDWLTSFIPKTQAYQRRVFQETFAGQYMRLKAKYDAAETTDTNKKYWARADHLSANQAANPAIRKILRQRSRYEEANNSYFTGLVKTLTNDVIGTGPKLQVLTSNKELNKNIEILFREWSSEIHLTDILGILKRSYERDGEGFAVMSTNKNLECSIKLDIKVIEAECCTTPDLTAWTENAVDGIRFDDFSRPVEYHFLKYNPGDMGYHLTEAFGEYEKYPAKQVLHYFTPDRPGQMRGIPPSVSTLELFAQLRRATMAVMRAFEIAAMVSGVIHTTLPSLEQPDEISNDWIMDLVPGAVLNMPAGYMFSQLKAEQPVTTYKMFKDEILSEIGRCRNVPFNVIACRSDGYNYASGRLDFQIYYRSIRTEQQRWGTLILDRIFNEWAKEALVVDPNLYGVSISDLRHKWFWNGTEHVDPVKEAQAQEIRLRNLTTTLADEWARNPNGENDWQTGIEQIAFEQAEKKRLGITVETPITPAQTETMAEI